MVEADDLSSITQSHLGLSSIRGDDHDGAIGNGMAATTPPLHGRDSEKLVLIETYQRLLQTQEPQVVFVHGTSGQGKTSLVDTLREHVVDSSGFFCAGKFFQDSEIQEPYSAITSAFSDLCDLVVQSPDFDDQSRNRILEHLATDGHLLSQSVNLSLFLPRDAMDLYSNNRYAKEIATFTRFRAACKAFLLAMASKNHPVVMFVDDLQWLDSGSAKLIEMFITDDDIKNVMFIFSYRDEEAPAVSGIVRSADTKRRVADIQLSNLDLKGVRQILAWRLEPMTDNIEALSDLTFQRTGGNPFFVSLFLDAIATEEFVSMNETNPTFDVDKIRSSFMVADSIGALLSQKVCRLPIEIRQALTVASLMGYSFEEKVLLEVPDIVKIPPGKEKQEALVAMLELAVGEGFIEQSQGSYQFTHDKVQKAFQDLVDEPIRERLHQDIGEIYLAQDSDGSTYNAAVHLNVAPGFLYCPEQMVALAKINLDASRYCQQRSAFDMALFLLRTGIELLDRINMKWSTEVFELSLELTESLARAALLVGDFDSCDVAVAEAMLHVSTKEQKVNILLIKVECRMAKNEMKASIRASTEALSELGVKLPRKATMGHVALKFMKLKFLMAGKTDDYILGLPPVEDESWAVAMRLLMHITFYALSKEDDATAIYAALLAMDLTLKYGLSTYAAPALSIFGAAVLYMGNIERAYVLGKLSLKLMERSPSREGDCPTLGYACTLLLHWREPICDLRGPLVGAAAAGFGKGDVIYSTYGFSQGFGMDMISGVHLEGVERSLQHQYDKMHEFGQSELRFWLSPFMQCVANFRSSSTNWCQLSSLAGEFMNSTEPLSEAASDNTFIATTTLVNKLRLANTFGLYDVALETLQALDCFEEILQWVYVFNVMCWDAGVAYYESFIADGNRNHLRKARKYRKHLERRDSLGPNASAFLKHLNLKEAFLLRQRRRRKTDTDVSQRDDETLRLLDRELDNFSRSQSSCTPCFVVARAYLDAGSIAERVGRFGKALCYYEQASDTYYQDWGAFAPAAWVEEKCEAIRKTQQQETASSNDQDSLVGGMVQFGEDGAPKHL